MPTDPDRPPARWLTAEEAADAALAHGLTLADAVALRCLADDREQADHLAARFARNDATAPILGAAGGGEGLRAAAGGVDSPTTKEQQ